MKHIINMKYRSYKNKRRGGSRRRLLSKGLKRPAPYSLSRIGKYARTAFSFARAGHKTYTKVKRLFKRKQPSPQFNAGYTITHMKAQNRAKRRRTKTPMNGAALQKALMAKVSYNLVRINEIEVGRGAMLLPNLRWSNATQYENILPLHVYSLDRRGDTTSDIDIFHQLFYRRETTPATEGYSFTSQGWQKDVADGELTNSDNYTYGARPASFWTDDAEAKIHERRKWYQKRITCELVMYGQSNQDTLYRVDVVRMDERASALFSRVRASSAERIDGVGTVVGPEWHAFWHSMVAPYVQNPLHKPERVQNFVKILKSYTFKIPEQSADFDRVPSVKTKFTVPLNRIVDYQWKRGQDSGVTNPFDPEDAAINTLARSDSHGSGQADNGYIAPKYRTFLVIRATNNDSRPVGATPGATFPSIVGVARGEDPTYDIKLRSEYLVDV